MKCNNCGRNYDTCPCYESEKQMSDGKKVWLINETHKRVLPWWGDIIIIAVAGIFYMLSRVLFGDDE